MRAVDGLTLGERLKRSDWSLLLVPILAIAAVACEVVEQPQVDPDPVATPDLTPEDVDLFQLEREIEGRINDLEAKVGGAEVIDPPTGGDRITFASTVLLWLARHLRAVEVKGLASSRIVVSGGAQFSRQPHWGAGDTVRIGPGEEFAWMATWGSVRPGDSTRVTLQQVGGSAP